MPEPQYICNICLWLVNVTARFLMWLLSGEHLFTPPFFWHWSTLFCWCPKFPLYISFACAQQIPKLSSPWCCAEDLEAHSLLNIKRHQNTSDDRKYRQLDLVFLFFISCIEVHLVHSCRMCDFVKTGNVQVTMFVSEPSDPHHTAILVSGLWPHDAGLRCHDGKNSGGCNDNCCFFFLNWVGLTCSYIVLRPTGFHFFFSISRTQNPTFSATHYHGCSAV